MLEATLAADVEPVDSPLRFLLATEAGERCLYDSSPVGGEGGRGRPRTTVPDLGETDVESWQT